MKIVIIGTINKDLILPFQGAPIQSIGGIYYSTSALSKMAGSDEEVVPISFVGNDLYDPLLRLLKQYPNVSIDGLIPLEQKNHEVILEYQNKEERIEKAFFNFPSLNWEDIKKQVDADFFLINFITGWDLNFESLRALSRDNFEKMYIDVHFLVMGQDKLGQRIPRRRDNIGEWLKCAKFVQMNETEYQIIAGGPMYEVAFFEKYMNPNQVLIITLAGRGAHIIFLKNNIVRKKHFPAVELGGIVDATGCGDVFSAGFIWKYNETKDLYQAMDFAIKAGAANCLLKGTTEMDRLMQLISEMEGQPVR